MCQRRLRESCEATLRGSRWGSTVGENTTDRQRLEAGLSPGARYHSSSSPQPPISWSSQQRVCHDVYGAATTNTMTTRSATEGWWMLEDLENLVTGQSDHCTCNQTTVQPPPLLSCGVDCWTNSAVSSRREALWCARILERNYDQDSRFLFLWRRGNLMFSHRRQWMKTLRRVWCSCSAGVLDCHVTGRLSIY